METSCVFGKSGVVPSRSGSISHQSATTVAWRNALNSYRKSLSDKDFKRIIVPAGPEDVANEVEKWQCRQSASRYARVAAVVRAGVSRMQRFSASIDMLAQGSPSPGCLLWGSIKFVLTIVQDAAEEYDKLCQALSRMVDCLPRIELYTEAFLDSELVRACVSAFYSSTLRFWTRACKFYRRHRLLNFIRVIWNDFDAEFSDLEVKMIENRDRVERAALAEHIGQSKNARVQQQLVNLKLLDAQKSAREKEIKAWLAPAAYDVDYYQSDLANARALRHPKTCEWIFEKEEIGHLFGDAPNGPGNQLHEEPFLWIYAKPGAGKTILSSRLIDYYAFEDNRPGRQHILYFFCKSTDADKNNATAVIRSLLYQLYRSTEDQGTHLTLTADVGQALDKSGKRRAVDFAPLWALFADHLKCISPALIILDALDECQDSKQLIQGLKSFSSPSLIKIIATSRREAHIFTQLKSNLSIEITPKDINADIAAYVEAKVSGSPRLSHSLVRHLVITRLSIGHSGMFLWVYLMLKELKSCFSVTQVQSVLANLPKGLDGIYKTILQRLRDNLSAASLDLCYKVLTWVVSAIRPLKVDELKHALSLHHEIEGDTLLFEYADKDTELVCGSLITVRQGTLQFIHLTVKEFLTSTHGPKNSTYPDLVIDPAEASLNLTLACLKCINVCCNESMVDLDSGMARLDMKLDNEAVIQRQRQAPLAEYASLTWMLHLTDCNGVDMVGVSKAFQETFDSPSTFYWVEACMAFQPDSVLRLLAGLEEAIEFVSDLGLDHWPDSEASCIFFANWCYALKNLYEEYGSILAHRPWEVHFLDLQTTFVGIRHLYDKFGDMPRRDVTLRIVGYNAPRSCRPKPLAHDQLQQDVQGRHTFPTPIFFIHDERRRLYFWGERDIHLDSARIFVQNATTGQRLPPAAKLDGEAVREGYVSCYGMSPSGEHIVVVYETWSKNAGHRVGQRSLTLIWQINEELRFKRRMRSEPWARVIFSHQCENELFSFRTTRVVFLDGGYCLTPSGQIHLASGSRRPLPDRLLRSSVSTESTVLDSYYSQDGKYLFISTEDLNNGIYRALRTTPFTETSGHLCSWKESSRRLADVSPSGRFLVLSVDLHWDPKSSGDEFLYLYDVDTNETIQLPFVQRLGYWEAKYQFARDETELIAIVPCQSYGIATMNVFVWTDLQSDPLLRSYGQLIVEDTMLPQQIHVNDDKISALMVLKNKVVQRVEFRTQVTFPDAPDMNNDFPRSISQVSKDGIRWAMLRYGRNKAQVQMTDVSAAKGPIHRLDLELFPCEEPYSPVASLSPDLSVLVVDAQIFSITEGPHGLTSASFTIQGLQELLVRHRTGPYIRVCIRCLISPCNSYVVFISHGDLDAREGFPSTVYAFRIDLASRSSTRLDLHLPKDLIFLSASFHPSQHLMLLTYASSSEPSVELRKEVPQLQIFIVELGSLQMKPIVLPEGCVIMGSIEEYLIEWSVPRAVFSDCGTFILMVFAEIGRRELPQIIDQLDAAPVATRYLPLSYGYSPDNHLTSSGDCLIETEEADRTSYRLVLRKLSKDKLCVENSDIIREDQEHSPVYLDNVVCYSSRLADADRFLLLGENDDEEMRLLIAPREGCSLEIKPISLTFNEAKRRLEIEWVKRQALKNKEIEERGKKNAATEENEN